MANRAQAGWRRPPNGQQVDRLIEAIERGNPTTVACSIAGVAEVTFYRWYSHGLDAIKREENGEPLSDERDIECAFFARRVQAHKGSHQDKLLRAAHRATDPWVDKDGIERPGDGRLAMEILERLYPKQYARQLRLQVDAEIDAVIAALEKALPREHFLAALEAIASVTGESEGMAREPSREVSERDQ